MTHALSWFTGVRWGLVILLASGTLAAGELDELGDRLVFYLPFEESGIAYLGGGIGYRFDLEERYFEPGRYSTAYRFQPGYRNHLPPHQAAPDGDLQGFNAGDGVELRYAPQSWQSRGALVATGSEGILWETSAVEIERARSPHRTSKSFLASMYLRADTPGVSIRLELRDAIDDTDWQEPIEEAKAELRASDPDAAVTAWVPTTVRHGESHLSADWQRVTASITVDARRNVQQLSIRLSLVGPGEGTVSASGLQLEQIDLYPDLVNFAADWIPGGQSRASNRLSLPLKKVQFDGREGTLATWFRLPRPEGGGARRGELVGVGGGWWRPVWYLSTGNAYLGRPGVLDERPYELGQSMLNVPFHDKGQDRWHHLAATWQNEVCRVYLDGERVGEASYFPGEPDAGYLRLGTNVLSGATGAAILDEVALWNRVLRDEELAALAAHDGQVSPLAAMLPARLLAAPKRSLFHRGEHAASLPLQVLSRNREPFEGVVTVRGAEFDLEERVLLSDAAPASLRFHPWKASPGSYEVSVQADDAAVTAALRVEVVASLPNPDFLMRAWGQGASLERAQSFSFNAAGGEVTRLPELLRSGLWADLRFDARDYHPLEPDRLLKSRESARHVAAAAAAYPHIATSMLNTEVGIPGIPQEVWFWERARAEIGLDQKPETVALSPLRIEAGSDIPPLIPDSDPAYRFVAWLNRHGKGWPDLNCSLAAVMREAGLQNTLFYTDQPTTTVDAQGLEMVDYWKYPRIPAGLVEFNRVANIAQLAGRKLMLTPGVVPWDFGSPMWRVEGKTLGYPPDMMRQYLWITLAHPLDHLGLYGFGELERTGSIPPGTEQVLEEMGKECSRFGLLTAGLRAPRNRVAYLQTDGQLWMVKEQRWARFFFNLLATRAIAKSYLNFDWIGDEHVRAGWLEHYDAVVMPGTWTVPASIYQALRQYQAAGGKLVIDQMNPAEFPGAKVLDLATRSERPESVAVIREWAENYRAAHPEPVRLRPDDRAWLYQKRDGEATFLFVVNDCFSPGILAEKYKVNARLATRIGAPHDRGEAQTVVLSLPMPPGYVLYDVRRQRALSVERGEVELALPAAEAAVLALLPTRLDRPRVAAPSSLRRGQEATLDVSLVSTDGKPADHRNVLEITAAYADGTPLDTPRLYRVERGQVSIPLRVPLDAPLGLLTIHVQEMISGFRETVTLQID